MSSAGFSGQGPTDISHFTMSVTIDFSILYLSGVPTLKLENPNLTMLVQNLNELRELHLNGVNISAKGKDWCLTLSSSVSKLQVLSLSNCYLSLWRSMDPSQGFASIITIFCSSSTILRKFLKFDALACQFLQIIWNISTKIFQVLTLQILDLSNQLLEGSLLEFPHNGSLETLVLSDTELPNSISNLKRLTRIELAWCNFSGPILKAMANLTQLVYLGLSDNKCSGPIPTFSLSKNLTQINLSHNYSRGQIPSSHWDGLMNLVTLDFALQFTEQKSPDAPDFFPNSLYATNFLVPSVKFLSCLLLYWTPFI